MSLIRRWQEISLAEWTAAYVPWALGLTAAIFAAEKTDMLSLWRAVYTSWVSAALFVPAAAAHFWGGPSMRRRNMWLLFWTAGCLSFLVHAGYALGTPFNAADRLVLPGGGGVRVAYYVLGAWWLGDVLLAWLRSERRSGWLVVERWALHGLLGAALCVFAWRLGSDVLLRALSVVLISAGAGALAVRLDRARGMAHDLALSS